MVTSCSDFFGGLGAGEVRLWAVAFPTRFYFNFFEGISSLSDGGLGSKKI